ncbi:MAG: type II toxin-antitoxin system RelB/DinJ family antitoxin [Flexilinea sp.]|nr:type II toxin-antitoxin system RelB/DinJ family antitoxin [Flexilinea sp.]
MAVKTANVMARVAPEVKSQAEAIMEQLGIPASVVINSLYKQIIMTKSIPFVFSIPQQSFMLDDMDEQAFDDMMEIGYQQAVSGKVKPVKEAFSKIRKNL